MPSPGQLLQLNKMTVSYLCQHNLKYKSVQLSLKSHSSPSVPVYTIGGDVKMWNYTCCHVEPVRQAASIFS